MVKILSLHALVGLILISLTYLRFTPKNYFGECDLRVITYASFYDGAGKDIFSKYEQEYLCQLQVKVLKTAGMLAQVQNLSQDYDVILGIDDYQLQQMDRAPFLLDLEDFHQTKYGLEPFNAYYEQGAFELDSAPLTYFIKYKSEVNEDPYKVMSFYSFEDFLIFLKDKNIKVAIPSPSTSVVGSLYLNWILDQAHQARDFLLEKNFVYVSSWTEAYGLFEKSLVGGLVSYETSQVPFYEKNQIALKKNQSRLEPKSELSQIHKVEIQSGHPNYTEYFMVSKESKASKDDKYRFVSFIYRQDNQKLLLDKNYMWPAHGSGSTFVNTDVRRIKVKPLSKTLTKTELLRLWRELR